MHLRFILALSVAVLLLARPAPAGASAPPAPPAEDVGGHIVDGPFRAYIAAQGGLERFGPPLSDALADPETGLTVQYFVYARLELHGEQVLPTRLGSLLAAGREAEAPFRWLPPDAPLAEGRAYVPESGHSLGGAFAWYHRAHGGVALLGHPISEEFVEPQPDGAPALVQYFERALLSYHPAAGGAGGEVRRAPLGEGAAARLPASLRAPGRPLARLATVTMAYPAGGGDGANIALAASRLNGAVIEPGQPISFLGIIGEVSAEAGYVPGGAIVGGELVEDIGGGICTAATALYRAAWAAGLPILERRGHRYWLRAYADAPGLDAAVYTPGLDFQARNDTGSRVYLVAHAAEGRLSLEIWGRGDGRVVSVAPPELRRGATIEVVNSRTVQLPGAARRHERVLTSYEPPPAPASGGEPADEPADDGPV